MPKEIKLHFVPKLINPIMSVFNISNRKLHDKALNLFYSILFIEFEKHKNLVQCEAVTQRRVVRAKIGELFKETFINALSERFHNCIDSENTESVEKEMGREGINFLNRLNKLLAQVEEIQNYEDSDQDNFCKACIDVMRSFKKNNNFDLYYQYVDKLSSMHEKYENYVEAALVLNKHAKRLVWDTQRMLPYHSDDYPEQYEAERKAKFYLRMVDLFEKGKDYERSIEYIRQLRNFYLSRYRYSQIQPLLEKEGRLYNLIMTKRRFFSTYFYVCFYGIGFRKTGLQGPFIYKGAESENHMDFINKLKKKYPQAELLKKAPEDPEKYREMEGQFFVAFKVDQSSEREWNNKFEHRDREISPKVLCYHTLHNIDHFKSEKRYRESSEKTANEYKDMHRDVFFYVVPKKFPTIQRRQPVLTGKVREDFENAKIEGKKIKLHQYLKNELAPENVSYTTDKILHLHPLENAIKDIEDKVNDLEELVINHELDTKPDTNALSMALNGVIDAAVNGGLTKYTEAFFSQEYIQKHPEHQHLLKRFKNALNNQIHVLEEGLKKRRQHVEGAALGLNEHLENKLREMKQSFENNINI
jgi:hypothetical protein